MAELAGKVASSLNLAEAEVPVKVAAAVKALDNKEADQVLTAFSKAVEAVKNKDVATAKASLKTAQKIDKENKAVTYYLNKLFTASPKFNVELIFYAPSYNTASLGFADKDRIYLTHANDAIRPFRAVYPEEIDGQSDYNWLLKEGLYYAYNLTMGEAGYSFPVGSRAGMGGGVAFSMMSSMSRDDNYSDYFEGATDYIDSRNNDVGIRVSFGYKVSKNLALGLSGYGFFHTTPLNAEVSISNNLTGSLTAGVYFQFLDGNLIVDSHATVPLIQEVYLDSTINEYIAYKTTPYPIAVETSVVGKTVGGRLNLSLKNILEAYVSFGEDNRTGVASRIIPAVEWQPLNFFAIRAGAEYDILSLNIMESPVDGFGALGGLSFRIGPVDIDANFTYMQRALWFYPGFTVPDTSLLVQVSWNGAFIKERKK